MVKPDSSAQELKYLLVQLVESLTTLNEEISTSQI